MDKQVQNLQVKDSVAMTELFIQVVANLPNFAGFTLFAYAMYTIVNRQLDMLRENIDTLEALIEKCCDDDKPKSSRDRTDFTSRLN